MHPYVYVCACVYKFACMCVRKNTWQCVRAHSRKETQQVHAIHIPVEITSHSASRLPNRKLPITFSGPKEYMYQL
jgi:hypothetical protein